MVRFLIAMTAKKSSNFTEKQVEHIAMLAHIPIDGKEQAKLAEAFSTTLNVISDLSGVNTANTTPTHQVTGLTNVLREDLVDETRMFSQSQALANAPKTHEGFFVVPRIIDRDSE